MCYKLGLRLVSRATNGYDSAKRLEDSPTTTSLIKTLTYKTSWLPPALVEISWTCFSSWKDVLFVALLASCNYLLVSLNYVDFCMLLAQSWYVTESFQMVLFPLLWFIYSPQPSTDSAARCCVIALLQLLLSFTLPVAYCYVTYTSCNCYLCLKRTCTLDRLFCLNIPTVASSLSM